MAILDDEERTALRRAIEVLADPVLLGLDAVELHLAAAGDPEGPELLGPLHANLALVLACISRLLPPPEAA
jgi:hypothetical protein